jgi:hypothetical protein
MFEFEWRMLEKYPEIKDIFITPTTSTKNPAGRPIGRYNLLCTTENFVSLASRLYKELDSFCHEYLGHAVGVVSKFPGKYQDGQSSDIS